MIVEHLLGIKKYVTQDGKLYCHLLKALYGCIQASKLWFNKLTRFLRTQGYESPPTDPCVMQKLDGPKIFLLLIYVDDNLLADETETEWLRQPFIQDYGSVHSYFGRADCFHKWISYH